MHGGIDDRGTRNNPTGTGVAFDARPWRVYNIHERLFTHTGVSVTSTRTVRRREDLCEVRCVNEQRVRRARRGSKSPAAVAALAETFKVLGDPTRLRVVHALSCEELCVCDLAALLEMPQSTISHSLRALRQMRLVQYRKEGKIAYYSLDDDHITRLLSEGFRHVAELL